MIYAFTPDDKMLFVLLLPACTRHDECNFPWTGLATRTQNVSGQLSARVHATCRSASDITESLYRLQPIPLLYFNLNKIIRMNSFQKVLVHTELQCATRTRNRTRGSMSRIKHVICCHFGEPSCCHSAGFLCYSTMLDTALITARP